MYTSTRKGNNYVDVIPKMFERTPKTVFAAIAISLASSGGDHMDDINEKLLYEWYLLWTNGIVPQRPYRIVRTLETQE